MSATHGNRPATGHEGARAAEAREAEPAQLAGSDAPPRVVTTGGKIDDAEPPDVVSRNREIDSETGERCVWHSTGNGGIVSIRYPEPNPDKSPATGMLDALAFSLVPPAEPPAEWLIAEMRHFLPIDALKQGKGYFGFRNSIKFGDGAGLVAWGGATQRDRVYFSIQGKGCALVSDWRALSTWLAEHRATIKRVDVAHDDFEGRSINIAWAIAQYEAGGFNAGGRTPRHGVHGDWLSSDASTNGRTFGVGNRASGKHCRVYEKGKQLGDPTSAWTRVEVEWRSNDRIIPLDVLTRPGSYLAGAYPCLSVLSSEQSRIRTAADAAGISFEAAVNHGRQHVGRLVNLMLAVYGGDYAEVVTRLRRDGVPRRIAPYSYHLGDSPEQLDSSHPDGFAAKRASE